MDGLRNLLGMKRVTKVTTMKNGNMVVVTQLDHSAFRHREVITIGKLNALYRKYAESPGAHALIMLADARLKLQYCNAITQQVIDMHDVKFGTYDQSRTVYLMYKGRGGNTSLTAFTFHRTAEASDAWKAMSTVFGQVKKMVGDVWLNPIAKEEKSAQGEESTEEEETTL